MSTSLATAWRLAALLLVLCVTASCAGTATPSTTTGPQSTSSSSVGPSSTSLTPAEFPVPIMEGGTTESAYATEITVLYPEASFDQLIDFYEDYTTANDGTAHDMFVGREWEVQGAVISVTPVDQTTHPNRPPGVVLFIRLP